MSLEGPQKQNKNFRHISESSAEYQEIRGEAREFVPDRVKIFGEDEIERIDSYREGVKTAEKWIEQFKDNQAIVATEQKIKEQYLEMIERTISFLKKELSGLVKKEGFGILCSFFEDLAGSPNIENIIKEKESKFASLASNKEYAPFIISSMVAEEKISDQEFEDLVRERVGLWQERETEFHERVPHILADFRDKTLEAIQEGFLPITKEFLDKRMQETRVYLADIMNISEDVNGDYNAGDGVIRAAYGSTPEEQAKTVFHELVHALSGRIIVKERKEEHNTISHQKIGLGFKIYDKSGDWAGKRFRWFNEAVTEEIALYLSGNEVRGSYREERNILQSLYEKGLPRELVYKAYFENYDPEAKDKVPAWKEVVAKISEIFPKIGGVKKLMELEEKIENERIAEIEAMEKELETLNAPH